MVTATDAALDLIAEIRRDHPDILFHQSGGPSVRRVTAVDLDGNVSTF